MTRGRPRHRSLPPGAQLLRPRRQRIRPSSTVRRVHSVRLRNTRARIYTDAAVGTALICGERKSQYLRRLIRTPEERTFAGAQRMQPVTARIAKTARPVVIERVERSHLAVDVDLQARLLDSAARAAIDTGEASATGDLPTLVVR